tara:strand:+ start:883 stop:1401 length:519 start_codon:yes stop_codon:yes gene_type:complete
VIDPVTALALASATFNGVKKAVQVGKEVSEIYTELSKWAGHVSDVYEHINQNGETKKPGLFEKITFSKSATAEAFDSFVAKRKIKEMEDEIRHMFTWGALHHLGLEGYREFIGMRRKIKADREKLVYDQLRRKKKFIQTVKISLIAILSLSLTIWFMNFTITLILDAPGMKG